MIAMSLVFHESATRRSLKITEYDLSPTANMLKKRWGAYLLTVVGSTAIIAGTYLQFDGKSQPTQLIGALIAISIASLSAVHDSLRIGTTKAPFCWIAAKYVIVDLMFVTSRWPNWKFVSDIGFLVSTVICVIAFGFIFVGNVRFGYRPSEGTKQSEHFEE